VQVKGEFASAEARKYPEQIVIVVAKDAQGKFNPVTLGWTMIASAEPPMMAIAVNRTSHSCAAIQHSREFVLCFPSRNMVSDMLFFGTHSGRDLDKLGVRGTRTQPATEIDGILFCDAVASFECRLENELETGDHVLFVGRVVASHVNEDTTARRVYSLGRGEYGGVVPETEPDTDKLMS